MELRQKAFFSERWSLGPVRRVAHWRGFGTGAWKCTGAICGTVTAFLILIPDHPIPGGCTLIAALGLPRHLSRAGPPSLTDLLTDWQFALLSKHFTLTFLGGLTHSRSPWSCFRGSNFRRFSFSLLAVISFSISSASGNSEIKRIELEWIEPNQTIIVDQVHSTSRNWATSSAIVMAALKVIVQNGSMDHSHSWLGHGCFHRLAFREIGVGGHSKVSMEFGLERGLTCSVSQKRTRSFCTQTNLWHLKLLSVFEDHF